MTYHFLYSKISYGDAIHLASIMAATFTDQDYTVYDECIAIPTPRIKKSENESENILVFPNPSNEIVHIKLPVNYTGKLNIYNSTGILIFNQIITNEQILDLDLSKNQGINILQFLNGSGKVNTFKVSIIR